MGPRFWFIPLDLAESEPWTSFFATATSSLSFIWLRKPACAARSPILTNMSPATWSALSTCWRVSAPAHATTSSSHRQVRSMESRNKMPFVEDDSTDFPISLYAATKKSNEVLAHAYSHLYRIPTTGLRFFTVYGPWGRPDMAIFKFVDAVLSGRSIELYNSGRLRRDFTYVDDVVEGIVRLLPLPPECVEPGWTGSQAPMRLCNIGNQQPVEVLHLLRTIEGCLGRSADIRLLPMQPGDVYETHACVDRLREITGYCPRFSIEEGIQKFVDWYRGEYLPLGLTGSPMFHLPPSVPVQSADLSLATASARQG